MSIKKSDVIIRNEVIAKFSEILNSIEITFSSHCQNCSRLSWGNITNVKSGFWDIQISAKHQYWNKNTFISAFKSLLEDIYNQSINANNLLISIQNAFLLLSKIRNTKHEQRNGVYTNTSQKAWALVKEMYGLGYFKNVISGIYLNDSINAVKNDIKTNNIIEANDVLTYFNQLCDNYYNWRDSRKNETIKTWFCYDRCHGSCHSRSRR